MAGSCLAVVLPSLAPAAAAVPVGSWAASTDLGPVTDPLVTYDVATLPDGTTLAAWETAAPALSVRVRPAGSSTWGPLRTRALPAGSTFVHSMSGDGLTARALGDGAFLVTWLELRAGGAHVRAVVLPKTPAAIPAPATPSGADSVASYSGDTNAAGRAAIAYFTGPGHVKLALRPTATASWGAAVQISSAANAGYYPHVAVSPTGAITAAWTTAASPFLIVVRSRATTSWGTPTTLSGSAPGAAEWLSLATAGPGFVLAQMVPSTGVPPTNSPSGDLATQIRVWTKSSATASWKNSGTYGLPAQRLLAPQVLGAADGSAVVTYTRYAASYGSSTVAKSGTGTTWLLQRRGVAGPWSAPTLLASISLNQPPASILAMRAGDASLASDGTLISTAISVGPGVPGPTPASGLSVRSGWGGTFSDLPPQGGLMVYVQNTLADDGRATLIGPAVISGSIHLTVQSTALPKPFVRARAALSSTAPKVGTKVACTATWTDAASLTYRWRRGSSTIGGAKAATYKPSAADRGRALSCLVVAKNPTGTTTSTSVPRKVR